MEATASAKVAAGTAPTPTQEDPASKCYHSVTQKHRSNPTFWHHRKQNRGDGRRQEGLKVEKRDQSKLIKKGNNKG